MNTDRNKLLLTTILAVVWVVLYFNLDGISSFVNKSTGLAAITSDYARAIEFFLYEVPKVLMLLVMIVFLMGIVRSYFSPEKTRSILENKPFLTGNIMASLLGIFTPFCTCSAVPLFIGFVEAGIPLGVTLSFLVAAPMINEIAVILLLGLFGWQTAVIYVSMGLIIAIFSGFLIGKLKPEKYVESWVYDFKSKGQNHKEARISIRERIDAGYSAVKDIVSRVWLYIVIGVGVGSMFHGFIPENFLAGIMDKDTWWSVPVSVIVGIPLYSNAAGIIPVVQVLLEKGASLGTVLAFMMGVIGLSLPEAIILRKVLKLPMIFIFFGIVGAGIIIIGYVFNIIY